MKTDVEICKRIAEIEGYHVSTDVKPRCGSAYANIYPDNCYGNYNPLTDKALCFDLMVKYMRYFKIQSDENLTKIHVHDLEAMSPQSLLYIVKDPDAQRAICLAIIEAHEGKS